METAQVLALICATLTPGAMRSTSGSVDAPERRISSWLMTKTAAAVRARFCSFLETEVTCTWRSCSRLASERPVWLQAEATAATSSSRDRHEARARSIGLYSKIQSAETVESLGGAPAAPTSAKCCGCWKLEARSRGRSGSRGTRADQGVCPTKVERLVA